MSNLGHSCDLPAGEKNGVRKNHYIECQRIVARHVRTLLFVNILLQIETNPVQMCLLI